MIMQSKDAEERVDEEMEIVRPKAPTPFHLKGAQA